MGTVNILERVRRSRYVKSALNVTADKVYLNREWEWGYCENRSESIWTWVDRNKAVGKLNFEKAPIEGLALITPFVAPDDRGRYEKIFEAGEFSGHGIVFEIKDASVSVLKKE